MALGSVSIPPFTRAEFENMLKKAMYSEGVIVFFRESLNTGIGILIPYRFQIRSIMLS